MTSKKTLTKYLDSDLFEGLTSTTESTNGVRVGGAICLTDH